MVRDMKLGDILKEYLFTEEFFEQNRLDIKGYENIKFDEFLSSLTDQELEDNAIDIVKLPEELDSYIEQMMEFLGIEKSSAVKSLTILPGHDKSGTPESFERFDILPSHIVSIVGPTGSGKSRLLEIGRAHV